MFALVHNGIAEKGIAKTIESGTWIWFVNREFIAD